VGTDIEPLSIKAARQNAALNAISERLALCLCSPEVSDGSAMVAELAAAVCGAESEAGESSSGFDVCVANILQGPLVSLAGVLGPCMRPGGLLALSGILVEQVPAVVKAYSPYFSGFEVRSDENWALVSAHRRGK
jgi:ribosomal protein L11 methylase PrmA